MLRQIFVSFAFLACWHLSSSQMDHPRRRRSLSLRRATLGDVVPVEHHLDEMHEVRCDAQVRTTDPSVSLT